MYRILRFAFLFYIFSPFNAYAQTIKLSLKETIDLAQKSSLDYKIALNSARSSFWNYQSFKASFLPKLSLNGTLPDYYRTINSITLPSGENDFVSQNVANSNLSLDLSQNIELTGGRISASSTLHRIDNFGNNRNIAYTSIPFSFSYYQANLFYNDFKSQKKIASLRLKEAQRTYLENLENISYNTVSKYFELLLSSMQLRLDQQNLKNIDTLVKITQARFDIGTVQLNDVLQSKVSLLNAKKSVSNSNLRLETAQQELIKFLNMDIERKIEPALPENVIFFDVDFNQALEQAKKNRKFVIEFQRRRLEAEQAVARTKSETGPLLNIRANLGVTQTSEDLHQSYQDLLRNQSVTIGFNIPLIDWGVNRSNRKRAEANFEFEKNNIDQLELSAEQELRYQIINWSTVKEQMDVAKQTSDLAQQRYNITKQKYSLGSINYTDFSIAQLDKDRAIIDYINILKNYWLLYYQIRRLTLFDFEKDKNIVFENLGLKP